MGVGAGLYMCDVVVKSSRSLSHLLMSSCQYRADTSVLGQEIGWEERLRNDLFCVELDEKP